MDHDQKERTTSKRIHSVATGKQTCNSKIVGVDVHVKHCFEIARAIKHRTAGEAVEFLNNVLKIDSDRPDIRKKATAVPFRLGSGNKKRKRSTPSMVGHRKGGVASRKIPCKG